MKPYSGELLPLENATRYTPYTGDLLPLDEPLPVAQGLMMRARSGIGQAVGGAQQMFGEQVGQLVDAGMAPFQTVHEAVTGTPLPNPVGRGLEESAAQGAAVAEQARLESQDAQRGVLAPDSVAAAFGNPGNALRYYGGLMAESAPTMAAAMATRNPGLATALTGAATTGQTYSAERAEGASPWEAAQTAAVSGGMEAGLGLVPFEKALGAGSLARRAITTAASEAGTEAVTGAGQQIASDAMKGRDTSRADINRVMIDSAIVGGGMGVGEAVLGSGRPAQRPPPRNPVEAGAYAAEDSLAEARARRAGPVAPTSAAPATAAPAADLDTEIDAGLAPPALAPKESPVAKKAATYDRLATEAEAAGNSTLAAQYRQSAAVLRSRETPDARVPTGGSADAATSVGNRGTFRENTPILGVGERADGNGAAEKVGDGNDRNVPANVVSSRPPVVGSVARDVPISTAESFDPNGIAAARQPQVATGVVGEAAPSEVSNVLGTEVLGGQQGRQDAVADSAPERADIAGPVRGIRQVDSGTDARPADAIASDTPSPVIDRAAADYTPRLTALRASRASHTPQEREEYVTLLETDRVMGKVGGRPMPGVRNLVAYRDAQDAGQLKPVQGYLDADNFKRINEELNHDAGDEAIAVIGQALREEFGDGAVTHRSGDEFFVEGATEQEVTAGMVRARERLATATLEITLPDGSVRRRVGVGFSYGLGPSITEAENASKADKQARAEAGLRTERRGVGEAADRAPDAGAAQGSEGEIDPAAAEGLSDGDAANQAERRVDVANAVVRASASSAPDSRALADGLRADAGPELADGDAGNVTAALGEPSRPLTPRQSVTPQTPANAGVRTSRVRRQVESQFSGYENAPKIEVWDSAADMPEGKSRLTALDSEDDGQGVEGMYDPDTNTVHFFANRLPTPERRKWVAAHEIVGHAGIRGYVAANGKGKGSLARTLKQARTHPTIDALTRAIASDRDLTGNEDLATEEALAELAAADTTNDWQHIADRYGVEVPKRMRAGVRAAIARFIESIKSLFRTIDPSTESFTDADWRKLVEGARRYVREGVRDSRMANESAALKSTAPKSGDTIDSMSRRENERYAGQHAPMSVDAGAAALDDLLPAFGEDIYGKDALQFFGSGDPREARVVRLLRSLRGKPDAKVTIYRGGVPAGATINAGDWVTLDRSVAEDYAELNGGSVVEKIVPTSHVTAWADALLENGYFPPSQNILKSVAPKDLKARASTLAEKFERDWLDEYADLTAAEKATADKLGKPLPENMQARRAENLRHGRFQDQLQRALAEYFEPVAEMLGAAKLSREGFADYLWWRHAPERDAYLRAKDGTNAPADGLAGISPKEAKANIAALPAAEREVYERAAKKIDALRKFTLDKLVDSGQIAEEVRDGLMNRWKFYVPLRGMPAGTDDPELGVGGAGKGLSVARNPLGKQAMGRKSKPSDILEQMKQDLERALIGAEKQRVVHRVEHLVMNNPDLGEVEPVDYEKKEVNGVIQYVPTKGDTREQLVYLHEGVPVRIKLADPMLTQALLNMNEPMWVGLRHLAKATRWLSAVKTSLSPYFMLINPVRDAQMAAMGVTAEQGVKVAKTAAAYYLQTYGALRRDRKGAAKDRPIDRYAREFAAAGGKTGYTLLNNIKDIQRDLSRLFAEHDTRRSARVLARRAWIKAGDLVEHANDLAENSTRLAVYSAMRDHGKSVEEAAKYAKDVTVNFNVRGRLGKQMTPAYMFFNAAIQGSARLTRLLKNPIFSGTMGGMVALSYALTLAQMMAMGDDDDGESKYLKLIKDHDRQRAIPFAIDDEKFFSMPMAYGPNMFTYLGSKMAEVQYELMQGRKIKPGKIAGQLFDNFASSMSPIQVNRGAYALLPEVARVPVQLKASVDDFGNPINYAEKFQRVEDDPLFDDGNATTGAAYEQFARALNAVTGGSDYDAGKVNLAPEHVRYVAEQGLGGLLRLATESYELAEKMILDIPLEAQDVPLSNVYVKSRPEDRQQSENYYENREDIEKARAVWKKAIARQDEAKQAELLEQHPWLQGSELSGNTREGRAAQAGTVLKALRDAERNIKALRDERESAYLGTGDYEGLGRRDRVMKAREIDGRIAKWQKWLNARQNGRELPMPE